MDLMIDDGLLTFLFSPAHDNNIPIHKTTVSTYFVFGIYAIG